MEHIRTNIWVGLSDTFRAIHKLLDVYEEAIVKASFKQLDGGDDCSNRDELHDTLRWTIEALLERADKEISYEIEKAYHMNKKDIEL